MQYLNAHLRLSQHALGHALSADIPTDNVTSLIGAAPADHDDMPERSCKYTYAADFMH